MQTIDRETTSDRGYQVLYNHARPMEKLVLQLQHDIVCLTQQSYILKLGQIDVSPDHVVMAMVFPFLRHVTNVAIQDLGASYFPNGSIMHLELDMGVPWVPAHFPAVETIWILSDSIELRRGREPLPRSRVFGGHGGRFIEVRRGDRAWKNAEYLLEKAQQLKRMLISPSDAAAWFHGTPGARLPPGASARPGPEFRQGPIPDFWVAGNRRRKIKVKVLAYVDAGRLSV
ncbi:hypothetical protein VTK73DRAFT_2508 [Phialemonium thermophilum]|uniref:Uncharacterized protein n=1 Tax=Phialemonium thermophilum TaxID=223376 RepID=A0ABR3X598_9PEZI